MKKPLFTGSGVAIVTPFKEDGSVDLVSYGKLIDWQIKEGTKAIIVLGTTGENPTINDAEFEKIVSFAIKHINKRVTTVIGTGRNDTHHSIVLSKLAEKLGADGLLVVTPYYNKTTQAGLIAHVTAIADSVNIPIILYNVPGRTAMSFTADTYAELAKHKNIVGTKEASGDFTLMLRTRKKCPDDFYMWSGNDDQITPIMSLGGVGVISVLANIEPKKTQEICEAYLSGDVKKSAKLQIELCDLIDLLFVEANPIPVKAALAEMGKCGGGLRLPLVEMSEKGKQTLFASMKLHGLLK